MDKCAVRMGMAATAVVPAEQAVKAQQAGFGDKDAAPQGSTPRRTQMGGGGYGAGAAR
jgi:hypothetical protein